MAKRTFDWERIEIQFRAGVLSLRELAAEHDISVAYIRKRADAEGWERDLGPKIKAAADAIVHKAQCTESAQANEKSTVAAMAQATAEIRLAHREDIRKARKIVRDLFAEMEACDEDFRTRVSCAKALMDALKNAITLEADAWGLTAQAPEDPDNRPKMDPMERARRVAFMLRQAAETQPAVH